MKGEVRERWGDIVLRPRPLKRRRTSCGTLRELICRVECGCFTAPNRNWDAWWITTPQSSHTLRQFALSPLTTKKESNHHYWIISNKYINKEKTWQNINRKPPPYTSLHTLIPLNTSYLCLATQSHTSQRTPCHTLTLHSMHCSTTLHSCIPQNTTNISTVLLSHKLISTNIHHFTLQSPTTYSTSALFPYQTALVHKTL